MRGWLRQNSAFTIFYDALQTVKSKLPNEELEALDIWKKALENVTPTVEVISLRPPARSGLLNQKIYSCKKCKNEF